MPNNAVSRWSRRDVLASAALMTGLAALPWAATPARGAEPAPEAPSDPWRGLKIGVASYTLRNMPLDAAIQAIRRVDLHFVSIKDAHMPMNSTAEERRAVARQFKDAGITPMSCGNITMKNDEADIRHAMEYARDAGIPTIVCSPDPASMPLLDRLVKEYDLRLAIHNHGPEDKRFPTPESVWDTVKPFDARIGLCVDVGHTARAHADPADAIRRYRSRLHDVHFKDITAKGAAIEVGRGVLDKRAILQALLDIGFTGHVGYEYEKDANDPLPGLAESVGFTRGLMQTMPLK